jgi:hypothetical protein
MPNPFTPPGLPLTNIAWEDLLPGIIKANTALANFNGILESILLERFEQETKEFIK